MSKAPLKVLIRFLGSSKDAQLPEKATSGSAGMDLRAGGDRPVLLRPGERRVIGTGISLAIPRGFEAQVRPRSGLAAEHGVTCLNSPGTIDSDYRGEVKVVLVNLGEAPYWVRPGERVAQLVVQQVVPVSWSLVRRLPATRRGAGGFGHTGR